MTWLRLDDKFVRHPKLTRLVRSDRWTWLEVLCYCAEYKTDGFIPDTIQQVVPKASGPFLDRCFQINLLDLTDEAEHAIYRVHDWDEYNPKDPTKADRQARWRRRKGDGAVDAPVDGAVDGGVDTPRAGARARPVPSPSPTPSPKGRDRYLTPLPTTVNYDHTPDGGGGDFTTLGEEITSQLERLASGGAA